MSLLKETLERTEPDFYITSIYKYDIQNAKENQWSNFRKQLDTKLNGILEDYRAAGIGTGAKDKAPLPRAEKPQPQPGLTHPNTMVDNLNE